MLNIKLVYKKKVDKKLKSMKSVELIIYMRLMCVRFICFEKNY